MLQSTVNVSIVVAFFLIVVENIQFVRLIYVATLQPAMTVPAFRTYHVLLRHHMVDA